MPDPSDLEPFVDQHLTAATVMAPIAPPLASTTRAFDARRQLKANDFDLSLVEDKRLRIVTLRQLKGLNREELTRPVSSFSESPRRDRLIESSLPIRHRQVDGA